MAEAIEVDLVVVGAGAAGLVAAREARRAGADVIVLEARERVGGRMVSEPIGGGEQVEMGGQWVGPTQERVLALASELGLETFPTHTDGANLLELDGRLRRYAGTIPRLNPLVLADVEVARRRLERAARAVDPGSPWSAPNAERLDSQSLASWLRRNARTRTARRLIAIAGRTVWGAEPADLSLLYALAYTRAGGGFDRLLDVEGGAQQDRIVGGSQLLATRIADELGERVVTGAPVRRIGWGAEGIRCAAGGLEVRARRAILAVAPPLTARIDFEPVLPPLRAQLAQRMAPGWLIKLAAVYPEPFWRHDGLSGEAVSTGGPATLTFDNSPPGGTPGVLVGFVGGADAAPFARLEASERRREALGGFARLFGERARRAERFLERDWAADPWSGGGPVANLGPGAVTTVAAALREPLGPIGWAGAETASAWCGYIDGAVRSGERAAAEALAAL